MAWAGTGVIWTLSGGVLNSQAFGKNTAGSSKGELNFVQISDSHIGFTKPANPDVSATLQATVDKINALPLAPEFIIHTGDISHTAKAEEFDSVEGILRGSRVTQIFMFPASTMSPLTMENNILSATVKARVAAAGIVSIRKASTSSVW